MDITATVPSGLYKKDVSLRAVSACSSALSVLGSALIILSYLCFRSLRTRARLILVHLALTDMGVGLANLVGIAVNFDQYYPKPCSSLPCPNKWYKPNISIQILCETQASIAEYCTLSSVLWTSCLAVYMYLLIVNQNQKQMKLFLWFSYVFCYGMPLLVTLWMLFTQRLGYSPYNSSGWCSPIFVKPYYGNSIPRIDVISDVLGYDLWIILTIVLTLVLYITVFTYVRQQLSCVKENTDSKFFWQAMHNLDYKFILIPVMFIFLRIWTLTLNVVEIYFNVQLEHVAPVTLSVFLYLSGIGDSGQGFVNAIVFVAFTHSVRKRLLRCACCLKVLRRKATDSTENSMYSETHHLLGKSNPTFTKKYSTPPRGQVVNSSSVEKEQTETVTPIANNSSLFWT